MNGFSKIFLHLVSSEMIPFSFLHLVCHTWAQIVSHKKRKRRVQIQDQIRSPPPTAVLRKTPAGVKTTCLTRLEWVRLLTERRGAPCRRPTARGRSWTSERSAPADVAPPMPTPRGELATVGPTETTSVSRKRRRCPPWRWSTAHRSWTLASRL